MIRSIQAADKAKPHKADPEDIKLITQSYFASRPEVLFACLFGSVAAGKTTALSDIDLAVCLDPEFREPSTGFGYQSELIVELSAVFETKIDLVILNKSTLTLKFQMINTGILIYCCDDYARRGFHEKIVRNYLDFKPFLRCRHNILRKGCRIVFLELAGLVDFSRFASYVTNYLESKW